MHLKRVTVALAVTAVLAAGSVADASADPVIAAAGDIACDPADSSFNGGLGTASRCRQKYTSDLLVNAGLSAVLPLGDIQYNSASLSNILASYDKSWGRVKSISSPVLGNHESSGKGYFDYFNGSGVTNGPAGERGKGYYSFDVGAWHLIALNSNCSRPADTSNVVDCGIGSAQEQWLRADLAAHQNACTLAYWHHPRFSSGHDGDSTFMQALWQDLYDGGVDVALSGHSHNYERFAPQNATGGLDRANGIRQFVAGGTGAFFTGLSTTKPNSELRDNKTFGVLKLTLHPTSYDWQFVPEAGKTFRDLGSDLCHGGTGAPDTQPPSAPTNLTANAPASSRVDLNWGAAIDDVGVTGYEVYRGGAFLGTSGTTSYSDSSVGPGTAYSYQVRAVDAAGNRSAFSNTATATTPPDTSTTRTFSAQADARVTESAPTANYATSYLRADGGSSSDVESYLQFNVSGISSPVLNAKLRLLAYTGTANGPAVFGTNNSWVESAITWANRPPRTSGAMDDKGAIASNSWVEHDVTPVVSGNGTYSFVCATTSSDGIDMNSREAASSKPELVLTLGP